MNWKLVVGVVLGAVVAWWAVSALFSALAFLLKLALFGGLVVGGIWWFVSATDKGPSS